MKVRMLIPLVMLTAFACASMTALQRAQQTHDYLALVQDTEANLCWGVPNVAAAIAQHVTPNHCSAPAASVIGLTDARHQTFNADMAKAITLHQNATTLLASGANADLGPLNQAITDLLGIIGQLQASNTQVASMALNLTKAQAK